MRTFNVTISQLVLVLDYYTKDNTEWQLNKFTIFFKVNWKSKDLNYCKCLKCDQSMTLKT